MNWFWSLLGRRRKRWYLSNQNVKCVVTVISFDDTSYAMLCTKAWFEVQLMVRNGWTVYKEL